MEHAPQNPGVAAAYDLMIQETLAQFQIIKSLGIKIEFIPEGAPDPYTRGRAKCSQTCATGTCGVFPTSSGLGTLNAIEDNPLLAPTDEVTDGHKLVANDVFRIVHDIFGRAKEGVGFGPIGEENAWQSHVLMYTPQAARAMTTETRGQNSWVNASGGYSLKEIGDHFRLHYSRGESHSETASIDKKQDLTPIGVFLKPAGDEPYESGRYIDAAMDGMISRERASGRNMRKRP